MLVSEELASHLGRRNSNMRRHGVPLGIRRPTEMRLVGVLAVDARDPARCREESASKRERARPSQCSSYPTKMRLNAARQGEPAGAYRRRCMLVRLAECLSESAGRISRDVLCSLFERTVTITSPELDLLSYYAREIVLLAVHACCVMEVHYPPRRSSVQRH